MHTPETANGEMMRQSSVDIIDTVKSEEVFESTMQLPSEDSGIGDCEECWTTGEAQLECFLEIVQRIEEAIAPIETFNDRRDYLRYFCRELFPLDEADWKLVYAIFLSRNPSELPHRHEYEKRRRNIESAIYYSGTVRKEGRNFRYPGELCFSVPVKQNQIFGNWFWPVDDVTTNEFPVNIGPRNEQVQMTVEPPRGESWQSLTEAQRAA